jgi:ribA/ribD-fused uncharacterized protein
MMWRKARLFGDERTASRIRQARSPREAKALGREVKSFDETVWVAHRWDVVVSGSMAKFDSAPDFRRFLTATGDRVLVEASPVDRIWGIGVAADNEAAQDPNRWRGLNLLGFALMEARATLQGTGLD